jgi:hypothetical protein
MEKLNIANINNFLIESTKMDSLAEAPRPPNKHFNDTDKSFTKDLDGNQKDQKTYFHELFRLKGIIG